MSLCFHISEGGGHAKLSFEDLGGSSSANIITINIICKERENFFNKFIKVKEATVSSYTFLKTGICAPDI
jgi:hypothetical protein